MSPRFRHAFLSLLASALLATSSFAQDLYTVDKVEAQPLMASATRLVEALDYLGSSLSDADKKQIGNLADERPSKETVAEIQAILDPYCIAMVHISAEARVKVLNGPASKNATLTQSGWKSFLVKVHNEAATNAALEWESPNAEPVVHASSGRPNPRTENLITPGELANRFLDLAIYRRRPMKASLSGLSLEYQIVQIYTTAEGKKEATLGFHVGQGTQDIGYRNAISILFTIWPSLKVTFDVRDHDGEATMASFIIRDNVDRLGSIGNDSSRASDYRISRARSAPWEQPGLTHKPLTGIYPLPARRVAETDEYPDFFFQAQIYRQSGEHIMLPPGDYDVTYTRGPEYIPQNRVMTVPLDVTEHTETFNLKRWINMAEKNWYSLDHHVHGGGCAHYESPAAGVAPYAMMRQALGEDLNVTCVLSWGPCWYHQKTFFEGDVHQLSTDENLMRYDVEVSGFPSSHAGHLCLLRLTEDDYPNTTKIEEWPSYTLPVLQWGRSQNGIVGYSHSGWGLEPKEPTDDFPNYVMAKFDGIGANEYIMTVTHGAVDFISAGDTPWNWELNIWYHVLNSGYRTAISGETDFPCIFDERIGMARSYTKLDDQLGYDPFVDEIRKGLNYVSDGRAHLFEFAIDSVNTADNQNELTLDKAKTVTISVNAAAFLPEEQDRAGERIQHGGNQGRPYWHVEKSRIPDTQKVPVELVVNGEAVARTEILADGTVRPIEFTHAITESSWVALRIPYSAHTNPIYVTVNNKPIRASQQSTQWCRDAVEQCWTMKKERIRDDNMDDAIAAYDHARKAYDAILADFN
ncbi:MAG: CehA/McbA family metallohydrolase [Candidatus Hydrogenedentota bacterium]